MIIDIPTAVETVAGVTTAIGAVWTSVRHMQNAAKLRKEKEKEHILALAKEEIDKVEAQLKEKIDQLEIELEVQKKSVEQEFGHIKEIYGAEIRSLGEKIEGLRQDLSAQHANMINLLTKLVNTR